jgi:Holliday junction resolvase RusA-like endonuclease
MTLQLITSFFVAGRPAPQGSKVSLGRGRFKESSPYLDAWRNDVRNAASKHFGEALIDGPVLAEYIFLFRRPRNHYVSNNPDNDYKKTAPIWVAKTPDCDKLQRSTNDALTGIIWVDDSQVVATLSQKRFQVVNDCEGAFIRIRSLRDHRHTLYLGSV